MGDKPAVLPRPTDTRSPGSGWCRVGRGLGLRSSPSLSHTVSVSPRVKQGILPGRDLQFPPGQRVPGHQPRVYLDAGDGGLGLLSMAQAQTHPGEATAPATSQNTGARRRVHLSSPQAPLACAGPLSVSPPPASPCPYSQCLRGAEVPGTWLGNARSRMDDGQGFGVTGKPRLTGTPAHPTPGPTS